jgi:hypothetical protein
MIVPYNVTPLTSDGIGGLIHKSRSIAGTGRGGAAPPHPEKEKTKPSLCQKYSYLWFETLYRQLAKTGCEVWPTDAVVGNSARAATSVKQE